MTRILLGPENPAGVVTALRDGLRRRGHRADVVTFAAHPFGFPHDRLAGTRRARLIEGLRAPHRYDVLHWQFATTMVEYLDAAAAHATGRPLQLMHYWGSDARTRAVTERLFPARARVWGVGIGGDDTTVRRRLRLAGRLCRAALVSDLELASQVSPWFDRVYVVPTPIELPAPPAAPAPNGDVPVVLHAPSHRVTKGTAAIVEAVERLAARRPVRLRLVTGVPHAQVLTEITAADVVIDQLNSETSGVFALEAMARGRPVLLEYRREMLAPFAADTPLVSVTADTLEVTLETLLDEPRRRAALAAAGRDFVAGVHAVDRVAAAVERIYAHAPAAPPGLYQAGPAGIAPLASGAP